MPTDFYETLGVERNADEAEIKRAYRALARKHHPDVAEDKTNAENVFKQINEAYEVLSDPQKRQNYDRFGSAAGPQDYAGGFGGGGSETFGDIFDMFFGQARGGAAGAQQRRGGPARGSDLRYDLEISLDDAFAGTQREISYNHLAQCAACKGAGAEPGTLVTPCDRCQGSGIMRQVRQTPLGQFVTQTTCSKCGGEGQMIPTPCKTCHGRGRVEQEKALTIKVPAGVDTGSRIRITGSGEAGMRGGPSGDLYIYLSVQPHERFRRDGMDVALDVPISFPQAAMGSEIEVPSLEGPLPMTIHPGTQSGSMYRLRGRGMPSVRGTQRGDMLVNVHVVVPTKLSRKERDILEEFAAAGGDRIEEKSFFDRVKDAFKAE